MNKKQEYKNRLEEHYTAFEVLPCQRYVGIFGYESAYLDSEAQKELRKDVKERVKRGHIKLENTNGKATYYANADGELVLTSYYTDVLSVGYGRTVTKLWEGYSVTTMNHINTFLIGCGLHEISKHDWVMMEVGVPTEI